MDRNNALGLSSDTDVAEVSIADRPTQPDVHRKDDGSVDPSVRATSSLLSLSSGESTELKRLSLPPRLSQSPHKNRPSLRRPSTSPMSSPQPPPQARLAPPSPRHSLSRRQHRSSPLSEVAFSSTNPIKLDDPVGGWNPGPRYKPSRISSVYLSDGLSERGMVTRQPWNVGEGSSSSTTTARRGSTITFSPSTASSSSRRPTTHSRYSYTYGQNSRASTSTVSTSSLSTNPGHRPRNHYRSSALSDSRYSVASSSSRHEDEPQLRAALDLDRLEARKQVRPGPETTDKRMSLPIGKAAEDRQAHWMAASSYGETPRFSRLGLHAQGVVLPISAREFSRRPRSAPNQHKSVSSPDVSISRGRSVRHSSVPSLTPPSPALIPSPTPTPIPTSPPVPPMLTRPRQVSISKPNKLKKPRPPSLPPPMPPRPIIILDTPPACATSLPLYSAAEPEGEVEVEHGPDVARGYQSQPQTYNRSNGGIDATSGILEVRREEDGNDPSLSPISMSSSETGLPRTSSDSSVASSAPSLCVSSSHSLNLSTSSSFYTTRTTFTEETTPSSSIFVLSVERETGEGDDEVHPPDLPEVGSNEQVDSEPKSLPECNLDDPPRGTPDIVPTLIQTAEPPSSDNTSPQPTSQRRRSIVSRVCSFRSVRSLHPRPRSRVTSSASVPPPPLVPLIPIPISTPVTLPPAAVTMPPPPPPSHSTSKRASLFRTSTGTKLKKKRRPSTVNAPSKNLPLAADAALNLGPNPQTVDVPSLDSAKPLDKPANAPLAKHPSEHTSGKRTIFDRLFFRRGVSE